MLALQRGVRVSRLECHGKVWVIDHSRPLASFNLADQGQLLVAMNYANLRPMSVEENSAKGSRFDGRLHRYVANSVLPITESSTEGLTQDECIYC